MTSSGGHATNQQRWAMCITSKVHPSRRLSLSASDLQFHRDLLMLHTALGPWALVGCSDDREKEADTLQVL